MALDTYIGSMIAEDRPSLHVIFNDRRSVDGTHFGGCIISSPYRCDPRDDKTCSATAILPSTSSSLYHKEIGLPSRLHSRNSL
jgi:hypothetical protein